jgi:ankyrin repeat protein
MSHRIISLFLLALLISATSLAADDAKDLRKAAEKGDVAKVHRLLAQGADANAKDDKGVTALMLAAGKGHAEIVQALLDAGADAEAKDNQGLTAAMRAECGGFADIVRLLNAPRPKAPAGDAGATIPCSSLKM